MLGICRVYLFQISIPTRAFLLFLAVCFLSSWFESSVFDTIFADRHNFVNVYLVKYSWGWTSMAVGSYLLHESLLKPKDVEGPRISLLSIAMQLFLGTTVWYTFAANLFPWIEEGTGICQASHLDTKRACRRAGYVWTGLDISGHCFLLLWNILFILENITPLTSSISTRDSTKPSGDSKNQPNAKRNGSYVTVQNFFILLLGFLIFTWEVMLMSTALHFHTTAEKFLGCSIALISWFMVYRLLPLKSVVG
eukprot:TRINITY_DN3775_c1_g1_i1.p1 TRINITY_DN3775_c1_g1~~TRINITY_DN3775_c1_g1_i1.p1  ORF type:complete len:251 (-),score=0.01 TRINITY_DN3775_c1_g1_i1:254-1006(-)